MRVFASKNERQVHARNFIRTHYKNVPNSEGILLQKIYQKYKQFCIEEDKFRPYAYSQFYLNVLNMTDVEIARGKGQYPNSAYNALFILNIEEV